MATAGNPFVGSGWAPTPESNSVLGNTLLFNNPSVAPTAASNAMFAWPGRNVNQNFGASSSSSTPMFTAPNIIGGTSNPGGLPELATNLKDAMRATGYLNTLLGAEREQMAPAFANKMFELAGPVGEYFKTLMNLGSPYYQAKQANVFDQGVRQGDNAAAQARQILASRGYGYAPSGLEAATIGGMGVASGANLVQNFLNSLFQNEQMQLQGAQGQAQLASLFNPSPLLGNLSFSGGSTQGPNTFEQVMQGLGSLFGGGAAGAQAGYNIASGAPPQVSR